MIELNKKTYDPGIELSKLRLIPGVVLDANDPKQLGRIKAYCPGIFDPTTMDKEALPWIYPFRMNGFQSYSTQNVNTKIWILYIPDNPYGYFYFPFFELFNFTKQNITPDNTDILVSRSSGNGDVTVHYNDRDGIVSKIGPASVVITQEGTVKSTVDDLESRLDKGHIYIGKSGGEYEPMVKGNKLFDLLSELKSGLANIAKSCEGSPYTMHLGAPIKSLVQKLSTGMDDILSETVSVN